MARVIAGMTMSLDGFVADPAGNVERLYPDFAAMRESPRMRDAIAATGAVVMGRNTFAMGEPDAYADAYEFQVPIFVVTTHPPATPPKQNDRLTFTFVTDGLLSTLARAKTAAGDKDVQVVGGPQLIQALLRHGTVDELQIDVVPVLLGDGPRLFAGDGLGRTRLQLIGLDRLGQRASFRYRVTEDARLR